jgi:hypothetical protein
MNRFSPVKRIFWSKYLARLRSAFFDVRESRKAIDAMQQGGIL